MNKHKKLITLNIDQQHTRLIKNEASSSIINFKILIYVFILIGPNLIVIKDTKLIYIYMLYNINHGNYYQIHTFLKIRNL